MLILLLVSHSRGWGTFQNFVHDGEKSHGVQRKGLPEKTCRAPCSWGKNLRWGKGLGLHSLAPCSTLRAHGTQECLFQLGTRNCVPPITHGLSCRQEERQSKALLQRHPRGPQESQLPHGKELTESCDYVRVSVPWPPSCSLLGKPDQPKPPSVRGNSSILCQPM